jgi:hypothetical protein
MPEETEQLEQLTVSGIPSSLVKEIEEMAAKEDRPRNRQVVVLLKEIVAIKKAQKAA